MDKHRIPFSLYGAAGFAVVCLIPTICNPLVYHAMTEEGIPFWREKLPPYPLGWSVALFAIPLFFLLQLTPRILALFRIAENPFSRALFTFSSFYLMILSLLPHFGLDPAYLMWGMAYAGILGIIEGLTAHKLDMSFVSDGRMATEAKIAKLNLMADKWFRGLNIFNGVLIASAVGGGIHFVTFNPSFVGRIGSTHANTGIGIEILLLIPGIATGIYWSIFQKINEIEAQFPRIQG